LCMQVIKLISQVIADFANGEISQATALFDTETTIQQYLDKSFFKTASLIAASCRSSAVFSGCDEAAKAAMFDYGKHLGLAFQVRHRCKLTLIYGSSLCFRRSSNGSVATA
jgi:all-trans-nonaprenyl-diphosphate synthase